MKKIIYLIVLFFVQLALSQTTAPTALNENDNLIYDIKGIEVKPEFPGGLTAFYSYITNNYKTPNVKNLQGKVIVMFIVEKDGSLTDIKVLKDVGYGSGDEAIRVLKACPKWTPASQNGKLVRCKFALPISIETEKEIPAKRESRTKTHSN